MTVEPTTQKGFRTQIRARMEKLGVYRSEFEMPIRRLADIYWRRLNVQGELERTGYPLFVQVENGAVKNPFIVELEKLDKQALEMERELGMTPNALKRMNESAMPGQGQVADADPLSAALAGMRLIS